MKFFKHFTDAHRGRSLMLLLNECGYAGIGRYWTFIEICAEKLEKRRDEEWSEDHCSFEFEVGYLTRILGFGNRTQTLTYLGRLADLGLTSFERREDVALCSVPKLLECLDRDSRRARIDRAPAAPKKKKQEEEEDKKEKKRTEADASSLPRLAFLWNEYGGALPKVQKTNAARNKRSEQRFREHPEEDWVLAIKKISASDFCNGKSDRGWKATFDWLLQPETFLKVLEGKYDNRASITAEDLPDL